MRTTIDIPDSVLKGMKLQAVREGVTMKEWFVGRLVAAIPKDAGPAPHDEAARFRRRFRGRFEAEEIESFRRQGRA